VLEGKRRRTIVGASAVRAPGAWRASQVKSWCTLHSGWARIQTGRVVAEKMSDALGKAGDRRNRGGGNTIIGMDLAQNPGPTVTLAARLHDPGPTNDGARPQATYDPLKDLQPIRKRQHSRTSSTVKQERPVRTFARVRRLGEQADRARALRHVGVGNQSLCEAELRAPETISKWRKSPKRGG